MLAQFADPLIYRIAGDLGTAGTGARALTGPEIEALDEEGLRAAMRDVSVHARGARAQAAHRRRAAGG